MPWLGAIFFTFQLVLRHIAGNTGVQYVTRVPPRVSTQSVAQGNRPRVWLTQFRLFPSSLPSRLKQNKWVWLGNVEDMSVVRPAALLRSGVAEDALWG